MRVRIRRATCGVSISRRGAPPERLTSPSMADGYRTSNASGRIWATLALALLTGCTSFAGMDDRGATVQRYFGYLEVTQPPSVNMPPNAEVEGIRVYGIKVAQGFTLGYSDTNVVRVPMDCRAVILVKTQEQLDQVKQLLSGKESDICGAVTPD